MLSAYGLSEKGLESLPATDAGDVPASAGWVDLYRPTPEEDRATEHFLGASVPTREESQEIEFSSRFYTENGAAFMTASILTGVDSGKPRAGAFHLGHFRPAHRHRPL